MIQDFENVFLRTNSLTRRKPQCSFDSYNQHLKPPNEPVLVDSVRPLIDAFIKTKIIPSIVKQEIESKVYAISIFSFKSSDDPA